ncbi:MAG: homocysteine biosynthesis protein, partial [Candidatus Bathyarchaeia archaeon]
DAKRMSPDFIRGGAITRYGTTLYVGVGIPIPILNEGLAAKAALKDEEIFTDIVDYGVPRRDRPKLGKVSYSELKSGRITINGRDVKTSPLSSIKKAREVAEKLKKWITEGLFFLSSPVERLPTDTQFRPMRQREGPIFLRSIAHPAVTCAEDEDIKAVAAKMISNSVNHVVVTSPEGRLTGIVTSWDITRAVANGIRNLNKVITRRVFTALPDETVDVASIRMAQHGISALPIIDSKRNLLGIVTSEDIAKLIGRR